MIIIRCLFLLLLVTDVRALNNASSFVITEYECNRNVPFGMCKTLARLLQSGVKTIDSKTPRIIENENHGLYRNPLSVSLNKVTAVESELAAKAQAHSYNRDESRLITGSIERIGSEILIVSILIDVNHWRITRHSAMFFKEDDQFLRNAASITIGELLADKMFSHENIGGCPFKYSERGDSVIVVDVYDYLSWLDVGDIIVEINGEPASKYLKSENRCKLNESVRLKAYSSNSKLLSENEFLINSQRNVDSYRRINKIWEAEHDRASLGDMIPGLLFVGGVIFAFYAVFGSIHW